jgi:Pirin C-terminal cupin domain
LSRKSVVWNPVLDRTAKGERGDHAIVRSSPRCRTADGAGRRYANAAGRRERLGLASPAQVSSPLFYAEAQLSPSAQVPLPDEHEERGAYIVNGSVEVAGQTFDAGRMVLFRSGDQTALSAGSRGARLLLFGGAIMDGPRYIFWNFVSSSPERIEQAKADWKGGRFAEVPGDEREFIPLPDEQAPQPPLNHIAICLKSFDDGQASDLSRNA